MIFIRGARQLLTLRGPAAARRGVSLSDLGIIADGAVLLDGERIREVGPTRRVENLKETRSAVVIDATGKVVAPGFVDPRAQLLANSLAFSEMAPRPRSAALKVWKAQGRRWAHLFASHGTTTVGALGVVGSQPLTELDALRTLKALRGDPVEILPAVLAAKPRPPIRGASGPTDLRRVIDLLPGICRRRLAVLCEVESGPAGFDAEQGRQIARAATAVGLLVRVAGQASAQAKALRMAIEEGALSVVVEAEIGATEVDALSGAKTIALLMPARRPASEGHGSWSARKLADGGAAIALASGFGLGAATLSMQTVLSLACRDWDLSPAEAFVAATINTSATMGEQHRLGSLEPGKQADLAIFDASDYREIPYHLGMNLCSMTMRRGKIIYQAGSGTAQA